eukprot:1159610-Pelagomonas_calceolata.AAC.4
MQGVLCAQPDTEMCYVITPPSLHSKLRLPRSLPALLCAWLFRKVRIPPILCGMHLLNLQELVLA